MGWDVLIDHNRIPYFFLAFPAQLEISRVKVMNLAKRAALPDDEVRSILHKIQP